MEAVVKAVSRLSTSERQILELVSDGQLGDLFPFHPRQQDVPDDFASEEDLQEASAVPLGRERQGSLIQSGMPPSSRGTTDRVTVTTVRKPVRTSED